MAFVRLSCGVTLAVGVGEGVGDGVGEGVGAGVGPAGGMPQLFGHATVTSGRSHGARPGAQNQGRASVSQPGRTSGPQGCGGVQSKLAFTGGLAQGAGCQRDLSEWSS
ncbi:MAG: hypothetical protein CML60_00200, partial [Rhodobacteraceae bacterium]|nr:hypothetical protein [Paracoccaceae bacterium]